MSATDTTRIQLWSGPRNISTALMYSFARRADTRVLDEPLYGWYLRETGMLHPGREEILQSMECDGRKVIAEQLLGEKDRPVLFAKQMTHHLLDLPKDFLLKCKNVVLIRHPAKVLLSYNKVIENPTLDDIGIRQSHELYQYLRQHKAHAYVADGDEILKDPAMQLQALCAACDIAFDEAMLQWPAGPIPEDGIWAKYWYKRVHRSTGFEPFEEKSVQLPDYLEPVATEAMTYYHALSDIIR